MHLQTTLRRKFALALGAGLFANGLACVPDLTCADLATCAPDPVEGGLADVRGTQNDVGTLDGRASRSDASAEVVTSADAEARGDASIVNEGSTVGTSSDGSTSEDQRITVVYDGGATLDGAPNSDSSGGAGQRDSSVESGADAPSCSGSQTSCSGTCVDLKSNEQHCGSCTIACTSGKVCDKGACVTAGPCTGMMDGNSCSDGNACTQGDKCQSGACVSGSPVTCPGPTECHVAGSCESNGTCSTPNAPDNAPCNRGLGTCTSGVCSTPRFTRLGDGFYAVALSDDGAVVAGNSKTSGAAARWTRSKGWQALPGYNGKLCSAATVSGDGVYIFGDCDSASVRWKGTDAPIDMGFPAGFDNGHVTSANTNGFVAAGEGVGPNSVTTILWNNGSRTALAAAPGNVTSEGRAINGDGTVVAGVARTADGFESPYRWTEIGGMELLALPSGTYSGVAEDVSLAGDAVVGFSPNGAWIWKSGAARMIGGSEALPGVLISGDGKIVVGWSHELGAWISNAGTTAESLAPKLGAAGVDLADFPLTDVIGVSANGKVICGPNWLAILP